MVDIYTEIENKWSYSALRPKALCVFPRAQCFWETSDDAVLFCDDLPLCIEETTLPDDNGFYFFDSVLFPVELEQIFIGSKDVFSCIWPLLDLYAGKKFSVSTYFVLYDQRRSQLWKRYIGNLQTIFLNVIRSLILFYFVSFSLFGIGYFCELVTPKQLRIVVSNTNDLIITAPEALSFGCRPSTNNLLSTFFCYSGNFQTLRLYAQFVRNLVFFNVYEYQGLLYSKEKKKKKITKRKQK